MAAIQIHKFQNPVFFQNMETMLSNKKYGDTIFLVNESQFHASSHVVSVTSPELESLLNEHFKNCGDREVRIGEVKYEESFVVILRYIYGLTLDFTQVKKEILCEVIVLAERFKLPALTLELKKFLSNLECFEIDTVVVLLNTAKVFHLDELLGRLTIFAIKNAEKLIKHASFIELRYDILCDFVKSDFFNADEIDILKGVLTWHSNNMENPINDVEAVKLEVDNSLEVEEERNNSEENDGREIVEIFSQNVLKTLLSHIRVKELRVFDMVNLSVTEPYVKYKRFFENYKYFSSSSNQRMYIAPNYTEKFEYDISKNYSNLCKRFNTIWPSKEEYIIQGMKWITRAEFFNSSQDDTKKLRQSKVYLKCVSLKGPSEWKCTVVCQVKMLSLEPVIIIPGETIFTTLTLSRNNPCVEIGTFYYPHDWREAYMNKTNVLSHLFEVVFKSIHIRIEEETTKD